MNIAKNIVIRQEQPKDYQQVELLTRQAFWNLYEPGCSEHYLVHVMRSHPDFIAALDLVMTIDDQIMGNIMYTKAWLVAASGDIKPILTFGPVSIAPEYQRQGFGKQLLNHSFKTARQLGYDTIVIFGMPSNYVARGFVSAKRHQIATADGRFPAAMLVKELVPGCLKDQSWTYHDSPVMAIDAAEVEVYDQQFEPWAKRWQPSQETFNIISHATL
uniref:Acetyltransferase n=1 Tax=Lactiplantibacillus pentosus IG1 TaxID=1042160 RepID=G0M591_LACPE|nr:acetyltransferase [Lactiplantibacillus pentosus IG1]